ncbi:MAG: hypothetical protein ACKPKO_13480, partial [Candidatus Fonsibacter sp.]
PGKQILQCRDTVMLAIRSQFLIQKHTRHIMESSMINQLLHISTITTLNNLNLNNNICIKHSSFMITILSFIRRISKKRRTNRENTDTNSKDYDTIGRLVKGRENQRRK